MTVRLPKGTLAKRGNIYWLRYKHSGKAVALSLKTKDIDEAKRCFRREMNLANSAFLHEAAENGYPPPKSSIKPSNRVAIADGFEKYIASRKRPQAGAKTLRQYACQYSRFKKWIATSHPGIQQLSEVNYHIAECFADSLDDLAAGTYNKYVNLLEMMFRVLRRDAGLRDNPWAEIERQPLEVNGRRDLSSEEIRTLLNAATGEVKTLILLGTYTGQRLGDCCLLKWRQVDIEEQVINLIPRKTRRSSKREIHLPLRLELYHHLMSIRPADTTGYVAPGYAEKYKQSSQYVVNELQGFFHKCGFCLHREGTGKGTGKRAVVEVGFHSLRHSFVSICRNNGIDDATIEAIVGRSYRLYSHVHRQNLQKAVATLPSINTDKPADFQTIKGALDAMTSVNWLTIRDWILSNIPKEKTAEALQASKHVSV